MAAVPQRAPHATPGRDDDAWYEPVSRSAYRAPHTRRRAAHRSRLMRAFVIFVAALMLLAVGRVALSFAVVQKNLQTEAIVREERQLTSENLQLQEDLAQLGSTVRIRHIAESQLGLVDATHPIYLRAGKAGTIAEVAANR